MSDLEAVNLFNSELSSLYDVKPPISKGKMTSITRAALKAVKLYKHVVQSVEKFIQKCKPEYKIPGLYVIDSIIRQSRHQFGSEKDVFAVRFARNLTTTFVHLYKCPDDDKAKIIRVLNLWQKNKIFNPDVIAPLFDLANPNHPIWETINLQQEKAEHTQSTKTSNQHVQQPQMQQQQDFGQNDHMGMGNKVHFKKELLDYDYDDDFEEQQQQQQYHHGQPSQQQQQHQQQQNQQQQAENIISNFDALGSILTNPEVLRQLQTLQEQMAAAAAASNQYNPEQERQRKLAELNKQEAAFDQRLAQTIGRLPFAVDCDFESKKLQVEEEQQQQQQQQQQRKVDEFTTGQLLPPPFFQQMESGPPIPPLNYGGYNRVNYGNLQHQLPVQLQQEQQQQQQPFVQEMMSHLPPNNAPPFNLDNTSYNFSQQPPPVYTIDDKDSRTNNRSRRKSRSRSPRSRSRRKYRSSRSRSRSRRRGEDKERDKERVRRGFPPSKKEHLSVCSTTLWVGHLSKLVSQEEISDTFGVYGDIVSIDVIPPRGCAFIVMNRRQDALKALDRLKNVKLQGKAITLAWAPGKGMKGREWKDYWEVDNGVSYVPWSKLMPETNIEEFEDGGCIDESTLPSFLQDRLKSMQQQQVALGDQQQLAEKIEQPDANTSSSLLPTLTEGQNNAAAGVSVPMDTDSRPDLSAVAAHASILQGPLPVPGQQNAIGPRFAMNPQMMGQMHHPHHHMMVPPPNHLLGPGGPFGPPPQMLMAPGQPAQQLMGNGLPPGNGGPGLLGDIPRLPGFHSGLQLNGMDGNGPMGPGPLGMNMGQIGAPVGGMLGGPIVSGPLSSPFRPQQQPPQQQQQIGEERVMPDITAVGDRRGPRDGQKRKKSRFDTELEPQIDNNNKEPSGGGPPRPLFERLQNIANSGGIPGMGGPGPSLLGTPDRISGPGFTNGIAAVPQQQPPQPHNMHMERDDEMNRNNYIRPLMPNWFDQQNNGGGNQNQNPFINPQNPNPFLNNPFVQSGVSMNDNPFDIGAPGPSDLQGFGNSRGGFNNRGGGPRGNWGGRMDRDNDRGGPRGGRGPMGTGRGGWGQREDVGSRWGGDSGGRGRHDNYNRDARDKSNDRDNNRDRDRDRDRGDRNSRERNSSSRDRDSSSWSRRSRNNSDSRRRNDSDSEGGRDKQGEDRAERRNRDRVSESNITDQTQDQDLDRGEQRNRDRVSEFNTTDQTQDEDLDHGEPRNIDRVSESNITDQTQDENLDCGEQRNTDDRVSEFHTTEQTQDEDLDHGERVNIVPEFSTTDQTQDEDFDREEQRNRDKVSEFNTTDNLKDEYVDLDEPRNIDRVSEFNTDNLKDEYVDLEEPRNIDRVSEFNTTDHIKNDEYVDREEPRNMDRVSEFNTTDQTQYEDFDHGERRNVESESNIRDETQYEDFDHGERRNIESESNITDQTQYEDLDCPQNDNDKVATNVSAMAQRNEDEDWDMSSESVREGEEPVDNYDVKCQNVFNQNNEIQSHQEEEECEGV